MALTNEDKCTLEEIMELDGHCLDSRRCKKCPFRAICLPEFLNISPPSSPQRLKMAQDILVHHCLIDDEIEVEDINKDYKWDRQS
jgi:hypothetical protein